jgi:hypothetical protein
MDLSKLSSTELSALQVKVSGLIEKGEKTARAAALEQIYAVAHRLGIIARRFKRRVLSSCEDTQEATAVS